MIKNYSKRSLVIWLKILHCYVTKINSILNLSSIKVEIQRTAAINCMQIFPNWTGLILISPLCMQIGVAKCFCMFQCWRKIQWLWRGDSIGRDILYGWGNIIIITTVINDYSVEILILNRGDRLKFRLMLMIKTFKI